MTNWTVVYAEQAQQDLRDIFEHIAFSLLSPENAKGQVSRIINAAARLNHLPLRHPLYEKEPWRSNGLRLMPVDNFVVFYQPVETRNVVAIIRIMYGKRKVDEQPQATDSQE